MHALLGGHPPRGRDDPPCFGESSCFDVTLSGPRLAYGHRQTGHGGDAHMTEQATDMPGAQSQESVVVVVGSEGAPVAEPSSKPQPRSGPKWELVARERVKAAVRRFNKPLVDLVGL